MFLAAIAKVGALLQRSGFGILLTNCVDRAGVDAQLLGATGGKFVQIKARKPFAAKAQRVLLAIIAVVPNEIHRTRLLAQQAVERLYAVSVDQYHTVIIYSKTFRFKTDNTFLRFAPALYLPALKDRVSREF
jgi:hypothetical protein